MKSKKNLIYIHGFSANKLDHPMLAKAVKKAGYKFYTFDLPGHGSLKDLYDIEDITFDFLVKYVIEQIKKLNLPSFVIMGHSMGGGLTSVLAGEKAFGNKLKGIILEAPHNKRVVNRSFSSIRNTITLIKEEMTRKLLKPKLTHYFRDMAEQKEEYSSLLLNILNISSLNRIQNGIDKIDVPALLLLGEKDIYIPLTDTYENYMSNVDDLEVHIIHNAAHCVSVDQPNLFYKYFTQFLKSFDKNGQITD